MELQSLQETIQQKVVLLLSDVENVVKQTLIENGITRLCVFFGRQKGDNLPLLPFHRYSYSHTHKVKGTLMTLWVI